MSIATTQRINPPAILNARRPKHLKDHRAAGASDGMMPAAMRAARGHGALGRRSRCDDEMRRDHGIGSTMNSTDVSVTTRTAPCFMRYRNRPENWRIWRSAFFQNANLCACDISFRSLP